MRDRESFQTHDLTQGAIGRQLIVFALPFFVGSLIQQLYNTVDLIFVGNFLGKEASAAVGAGSLLITCLLGFFIGISVGVGVVAARTFGAGENEQLAAVIRTSADLALVGSLIFTVLGLVFAPNFLLWLNTPQDILPLALTYIRIYFLSIPSTVCFNIAAGVIRALGNSRVPMLHQLAGGIVNVIGNALFICALKWGVPGAALATLCSQTTAAVLIVCHLLRMECAKDLRVSQIRIHKEIAAGIFRIGLPAAAQSMVITLSNLIVQSQINSLGILSIAAFTAYFKVENFVYLPIIAFGQANTTFVSQNVGANQWRRARKGTRTSLLLGVCVTVILTSLLLIFGKWAFRLFTQDDQVVDLGLKIASVTFPFYFLYNVLDVFSSAIRGAGKSLPPMMITVVNMCGIRMIALKIAMHIFHTAPGIAMIYPITWFCTAACMALYYFKGRWKPAEGTL